MTKVGWSAPVERLDVATARKSILRQHAHLRSLLARASSVAETALDERACNPDDVACSIGDVRTTMEIHLAFEESVLLPILREEVARGAERALHMLEEHDRQRALLAKLHREASAHPQLPMLAAKLAFLASWLLNDMAEEEQALLAPAGLRDDTVTADSR
jgi:iron-sulfur cluster repair protein YtfE (RIC family)